MALVVLSVVEQRLDAVRAVLAGASVIEVAGRVGVSRQSVHTWIGRYLVDGVAGLADRSRRPVSCPHQAPPVVEVRVAEMRREHPRWGAKRIRMELLRGLPEAGGVEAVGVERVPSVRTINRILTRHGLLQPRPRKRPRGSYVHWERSGPMQLWQIDIVGGVMIVNPATGEVREAKVVTGIDDHSRFCVIAAVVERATGRAVCLALAAALVRFGVPDEILTDNGKQFTDRFGRHGPRNGEVLFDKICRKNGITHRLTAPASPTTTGKVERFHLTLRRELLDDCGPFESVQAAQTAVDGFVSRYNTDRPHQALDDTCPVTPGQRFEPVPTEQQELIDLWLPPNLSALNLANQTGTDAGTDASTEQAPPAEPAVLPAATVWSGGAVEFDQVVPPSGNMCVAQRQFWLGPARAGMVVRFWRAPR